jgi:hypothetical protein
MQNEAVQNMQEKVKLMLCRAKMQEANRKLVLLSVWLIATDELSLGIVCQDTSERFCNIFM